MSTSTPGNDGGPPRAAALWNLPNALTWLRILMIPAIVVLFYALPHPWADPAACAAFALAGITDTLDGYYARKLGQTSRLGAFLDPVADKLMVAVALVLLVQEHGNLWLTLPAAVIIGREIVVSALREWMAEIGERAQVAVSNMGKWKTAAQMLALVILLANPSDFSFWVLVGYTLLMAAAVLTLWSMLQYLRAAWPHLKFNSENPEKK